MTGHASDPIHNHRGQTLSGLIVSIGVGTILALIMATILNQIFRHSSKTMAVGDANGAAHLIEQIVSNKTYCDNALRDGAGGKLSYNPLINIDNIPVTRIYMNNAAKGLSAVAIESGTQLNRQIKLNSMTLQEAVPGQGRSKVYINTSPGSSNTMTQFQVFTSVLILNFTSTDNMVGGSIPSMKIPITVAVGAGNTIDYCYHDDVAQQTCQNMGGTVQADGSCTGTVFSRVAGFTCNSVNAKNPPGCPAAPPPCVNVYQITGFENSTDPAITGKPICLCTVVCPQ